MKAVFRQLGLLFALGLGLAGLSPLGGRAADTQPTLPLRAAFYYAWYPEAWTVRNIYPFSNYTPTLGFYDSGNSGVIANHIAAMQYANIEAGIVWWEGASSTTDARMPALLAAAENTPFRWALYDALEGRGDPAPDVIANDLKHIHEQFGTHPAYLRVGGRFVVFVSIDAADGCGMVQRWNQANTFGAYLVFQVFEGYPACAGQADGWHQYSPTTALDWQAPYSVSISPGYWKYGDEPRLPRNLTRWKANVRSMAASGADFQLIATFNRWGEGASIESASEWASESGFGEYLDALHSNGSEPVYVPQAVFHPRDRCDEYEPNDNRASQRTGPIASNQEIIANLCANDEDNYFFTTATSNQIQVDIDLPARLVGQTNFWLYASTDLRQNHEICKQTNILDAHFSRLCSLPQAGTYVVRLYTNGVADPDHAYTLRVLYE